MNLAKHLNVLLSKIFAILWSVVLGATMIGETLGRHFWQRPLSASEMLFFALSITGVWLLYFMTRWWMGFLDERGF